MDTSKDYYNSVMRQFKTYGHGRTLEQFCRDEAVDYNWLIKAKDQYGEPETVRVSKPGRRTKTKAPDLIQLHYEDDTKEPAPEAVEDVKPEVKEPNQDCKTWRIACLKLVTPGGEEIEISASGTSAVSELLATLTGSHV